MYRDKQMLWVELRPEWKIENTGCCVCGRAAACMCYQGGVDSSCLFSWPFLLAAVVKAFNWRPDISLRRTGYMATPNQNSGPRSCPYRPFGEMMCLGFFFFSERGHHKSDNTGGYLSCFILWKIIPLWFSDSVFCLKAYFVYKGTLKSDFILFNMQEKMNLINLYRHSQTGTFSFVFLRNTKGDL